MKSNIFLRIIHKYKKVIAISIPVLFLAYFVLISEQKENIFYSEIRNGKYYEFSFERDKKSSIDFSDFEFDENNQLYNQSKNTLSLDDIKKLKTDIYMEYHKQEFNNDYKHRNSPNEFKYAKNEYFGTINDIWISFYFNDDNQLSIIKLERGIQHEMYYYFKNELIYHTFWERKENSGFMADNISYEMTIQKSWVLNGEIVERRDDFSQIEQFDSNDLFRNAEFYLQLYSFLNKKEMFHCRNRYAEFELGRIGFRQWLERNIDDSKFTELNNYIRNENYDFKFETEYEFEIDSSGNLNYLKKIRRIKDYNKPQLKQFTELIDNEIIKVLQASNNSEYKWQPATHNCQKVSNTKLLIVKSFPRIDWLSNTPLNINLKDKINIDSNYNIPE